MRRPSREWVAARHLLGALALLASAAFARATYAAATLAPITAAAATFAVASNAVATDAMAGNAVASNAPATDAVAGNAVASNARPAPRGLRVQLVDIPAAQAANPRALRSIVGHVPPGTTIHRHILIANRGAAVAHVAVFPDAAIISNGVFVGSAGRTRSELTTWTRTSRQKLILPPHSAANVAVTITVPKDATAGERYGVIFAQETSHLPIADGFAIDEVNRIGVRVYLLVGRGDAPQTTFVMGPPSVTRSADGLPLVATRVRNTGRRAVDLSGYLTLTDARGGRAGPFGTRLTATLAPGQSGQVEMDLGKGLPNGLWHARLVLVSGLTQRRMDATIHVADRPAPGLRIPRYLIAALAVATAFALFMMLVRRRPADWR
jgi:hypothetical protein